MCRLFGLAAGSRPVAATFWLLDAPDSLEEQSRRNADGSGIGFFDPAGRPVLDKQPEPAFRDEEFIHAAKIAESATFVAHVRLATTGARTVANTHPFAMHGRIMAHNGGFSGLERLDEQLGAYRGLVLGDTDSERYFALITQQIDAHGGDVGAGIAAAARWIAASLPLSSLNAVVAAPGELWALRYPAQHALHIIERPAGHSAPGAPDGSPAASRPSASAPAASRPSASAPAASRPSASAPAAGGPSASGPAASRPSAGGPSAGGRVRRAGLHVRSATSSVHAPALQAIPSVVVASEELDGEVGWRMLAPGELIHVRPDLTVESAVVIADPPAHLVALPGDSANIDT